MPESPRQEVVETGFRAPLDETLLLQHELALSQLALEHTGGRLNFAQLKVVDQLGQKLVKVESVGFLQNELKGAHRVLELVALESLRFNLVNAVKNLLEAVLQVVNTLAVDFLNLEALVCELRRVLARDFLH